VALAWTASRNFDILYRQVLVVITFGITLFLCRTRQSMQCKVVGELMMWSRWKATIRNVLLVVIIGRASWIEVNESTESRRS
jgi:hypothetical protein